MRRFKTAKDIKVGIVGYGGEFNMGKAHIREAAKAGMSALAVADVDSERLKVAQADYPGIQVYPSLAAMLKKSDVNLVVIITPHDTHAKLAIQALKAQRHVVCEKPIAITTAECDAMIAAARKSDVVVSTYHNRHWDGCIMRAVKEVHSGVIGEVYRIEAHMGRRGQPGDWWRSSKSISGGILYDWGVHLLEYSLQIIDSDIAEVTGTAKKGFWGPKTAWKDDTNEDEACAMVRFADGRWLTLCVSSLDSKPKEGWLEITGTKGTYLFGGDTWKTMTHKHDVEVVCQGKNPPSEGWRYYQNIAEYLVNGCELIITAEWARRPVHILDLANRSAEKGASLKAKYR